MNNALAKMDTLLKEITTSAQGLNLALSSVANHTGTKVANTGVGQIGLGASGGNIMSNSLASVPDMLAATTKLGMWTGVAQGAVKMATGAGAAMLGSMPNVEATTARSAAAYQVGIVSGVNWEKVGKATFTNMRGGITEPGGDMITGSILSSFGIQAKLGASGQLVGGSQYQAITSGVANAAKYLNMPNASAAEALGSLTSGQTSSALMQNFGMFTSNPNTGERGTPSQIFSGLKNRMGLNNWSLEDINTGLNGGFLGATIESSGLDQGQQQLFKNYLQLGAQGVDLFSTDPAEQKKIESIVGYNPLQPQNDVNTSITGTMQEASGAYVEGMKKAAVAVEAFEGAVRTAINTLGGNALAQLNAGVSLASKDPGIVGAAAGIGQMASGGMDILGTILSGLGIASLFKKGGGAGAGALGAGATAATATKGATSIWSKLGAGVKGFGPLGIGLSVAGGAMTAAGGVGTDHQGADVGRGIGQAAGSIGGWAAGAALAPATGGLSLLIPLIASLGGSALLGEVGAGIGGMFDPKPSGGENSTVTGAAVTNTGGRGFSLIHPVNGPITCKYGTRDENHPSGHYAVDYGVPIGTPVKAAASGTIKSMGPGSGSRSYGNNIEVQHADGFSTMYAHLNGFNVTVGQRVNQGDVIAQSGNTGFSTGPHLHFELRKNGQKTDPSPYLGPGVSGGGTVNNADKGASGKSGIQLVSGGTVTGAYTSGLSTGISNASGIIPPSYKGAAAGRGGAGYSFANKNASNGRTSTQNGAMPGISTGGMGGDGQGVSVGGNNVVINLSIKEASEAEARKFADMVKTYLEDKALTTSMGRM